MASARTIASKIYMLHAGNIIWDGNVNELETTDNKFILQFIKGESIGPIELQNN